jgi:hypothetical protein
MSTCERPQDSRFSDSRRAFFHASPPGSAPGPRDHHPVTTTLPLVGVSGFAMPKCMRLRNSRLLESRFSSRSLTCHLSSTDSCVAHAIFLPVGVSRFAIPTCKSFTPSKTPILRSPTPRDLLTRIPNNGRF